MQNDPAIAKSNGTKRISPSNEGGQSDCGKIRNDAFCAGSRLPSEFELADEFGVSRGTIREAVKLLVSGCVGDSPCQGTFVREHPGMSGVDPLGLCFYAGS